MLYHSFFRFGFLSLGNFFLLVLPLYRPVSSGTSIRKRIVVFSVTYGIFLKRFLFLFGCRPYPSYTPHKYSFLLNKTFCPNIPVLLKVHSDFRLLHPAIKNDFLINDGATTETGDLTDQPNQPPSCHRVVYVLARSKVLTERRDKIQLKYYRY